MRKAALILLLCAQPLLGWSGPDYLPRTSEVSDSVYSISLSPLGESDRLSIQSVQGLSARETARIYTYLGRNGGLLMPLYEQGGYITSRTEVEDPYRLLSIFRSCARGIVVYDPELPSTVTLATNIAGAYDCVIAGPDNLRTVRKATGLPVLYDLRKMGFHSPLDVFQWYLKHVFPIQRHDVLGVAPPFGAGFDVYRDYLIEFNLPTLWIPGRKDEDYDPEVQKGLERIMSSTPANIPVLGFYPAADGRGMSEFEGVKWAGRYGKFTLVNSYAGGYSYHSGVKVSCSTFSQERPASRSLTYDPSKKYVAMIMVESGDAPCYFVYDGFRSRQWDDPERGSVPVSYGITPSLRMLCPVVLEHIYETRTANDYFFTSISGAGYCYPFEGYGSLTGDRMETLKDYFWNITAPSMKLMGHDILAIYTHPAAGWSAEDGVLAEDVILRTPGLKSLVSGMHRTAYTASDANSMHGGASVHHTVTFWSREDHRYDDRSLDDAAVDHMEKEIRDNGDGQFILAMFYSWHNGPRRLEQLAGRLEDSGYVFVTLDVFDDLYRQSLERGDH